MGDSSAVTKLNTVKHGRKVALVEVLGAEIKQYISIVFVKMEQLSVPALFRQLPKGTYSVMTTLCWLSMVGMCLMLDWPTYS